MHRIASSAGGWSLFARAKSYLTSGEGCVPDRPTKCDTRADDVGAHGLRGLRPSPDQRPWQLPLLISVHLQCGGHNPLASTSLGATPLGESGGGAWTGAVQIGVWQATRLAWAYVASAMRSPAVAGPRFPCPLASESHQRTIYGGTLSRVMAKAASRSLRGPPRCRAIHRCRAWSGSPRR